MGSWTQGTYNFCFWCWKLHLLLLLCIKCHIAYNINTIVAHQYLIINWNHCGCRVWDCHVASLLAMTLKFLVISFLFLIQYDKELCSFTLFSFKSSMVNYHSLPYTFSSSLYLCGLQSMRLPRRFAPRNDKPVLRYALCIVHQQNTNSAYRIIYDV